MFIDGEWVHSTGKLQVTNPATGEMVFEVDFGGRDEALQAVDAAKRAFSGWAEIPAKQRADVLLNVSRLLQEAKDSLARVITMEMGKSIRDARGEIQMAIDYFRWYAEEARRVYGETVPHSASDKRLLVIRQPIGVVGAITPWNFPIGMIARKLAPALAAGCTAVVKPAPETPQSAIELMKLLERAQVPAGVVNLVIAPAEVVSDVFMQDSDVRKITFTGSTEVGKKLYAGAANTVKRLSMELGGHAPYIVFEDADLDLAVHDLLATKFRCSGEMCTATNRIYVQQSVADLFTEKLTEKVKKLKVGNGLSEDTVVGPLVNAAGLEKVERHVKDAVERGAKVVTGGHRLTGGDLSSGYFFAPTVLTDVTNEMKLTEEETFGPVAPILRFETEEALLREVNHPRYGLAAYCYTESMSRTIRMMEHLEYGMVGINDPLPFVVQGPFGGIKESGIGREGSRHGIDEYLEKKLVSIRYEK
ncbi:MAG TPA: NAD-dependent succinate-semialdehyde dehydrogenase [Bacillales bacterium]|nr:NAD-dependent succinate-semialdehyde dehydrogenase [Bacillales bacterium]